jgi:hypothetical protein
MRKLRNFSCPGCGIIERLVIDSVEVVECKCGEQAVKFISSPKVIGNTTGGSPSFSNNRY